MKNVLFVLTFLLPLFSFSQNVQSLDTINAPANTTNNYNKPLYSDSNSSSFVIIIPHEVKRHVHEYHSEQVYVISGEADMVLGDKIVHIKAGDIIYIPQNTPHAVVVTSKEPLKILSIQAPYYDGKDKVMLEK